MKHILSALIAAAVIVTAVSVAQAQFEVPDAPHPNLTLRSAQDTTSFLERSTRALYTAVGWHRLAESWDMYLGPDDYAEIERMSDAMRMYLAYPDDWTVGQQRVYSSDVAVGLYVRYEGEVDAGVVSKAAKDAQWLLGYIEQ